MKTSAESRYWQRDEEVEDSSMAAKFLSWIARWMSVALIGIRNDESWFSEEESDEFSVWHVEFEVQWNDQEAMFDRKIYVWNS